jgi:RHS repeat-associated protein
VVAPKEESVKMFSKNQSCHYKCSKVILFLIVFSILFLSLTNPLQAQYWSQLIQNGSNSNGIPNGNDYSSTARYGHTAVYDTNNNLMTIFGGSHDSAGGGGDIVFYYNDVWVLSTVNGLGGIPAWTQLNPTPDPVYGLPTTRVYHTAVYDTTNNRMIIFGGAGGSYILNDVWVLSNANGLNNTTSAWTQLNPLPDPIYGFPANRQYHTAIYDAANNRMTIFGGDQCNSGLTNSGENDNNGVSNSCCLNDVWVLSNANGLDSTTSAWIQLHPNQDPTFGLPVGRDLASAVYDNNNNRMIIFGGYSGYTDIYSYAGFATAILIWKNDTWVLSNANGLDSTTSTWTQLSTSGFPPSGRYGHTAFYDPTYNQIIIFGGYYDSGRQGNGITGPTYLNDVWELENANGLGGTPVWEEQYPIGSLPQGRQSSSMVYDATNKRMTIFGGQNYDSYNIYGYSEYYDFQDVDVLDLNNNALPPFPTNLYLPSSIRNGREYTAYVSYFNNNTVNQILPTQQLNLISPQNLPLRLSDQAPYSIGSISFLGIAIDTNPGVLPPGYVYSIPVYYYVSETVAAHTQIPFVLNGINIPSGPLDITTVINLSQQSTQQLTLIQPPNIISSAWPAVLSNLTTQWGNTFSGYQNALNNDANYLYQYYHVYTGGINTTLALQPVPNNSSIYSINDLYNFELLKADGLSVQSLLASAVDITLPAPGLGLSFSRVAPQMIDRRFHLGALGYGWYNKYEWTLSFDSDSSIVVNGADGNGRYFVPNLNGVYQPLTGNYETLTTLSNGSFALIELNGLTYHFSTTGVLTSISEPRGNTLTMGYNSGNLTSVTHSNGESIELNYNGNNRISQIIDYTNRTTYYQYDASGNYLTQVTGPGGLITQYTNNQLPGTPSDHSLSSITFPDNTHLYFQYDSLGRLSQQYQDGGVGLIQYAYISPGTITVSDNQGNQSVFYLGNQGQLLQTQNPLNQTIQYNYDQYLNLASIVNPANNYTFFGYNLQGLTNGELDPSGNVINLSYTPTFNELSTLQDANQNLTSFSYDTKGNLLTIVSPDSTSKSFTYDTYGDRTSYTNGRGQKITYLYNSNGQVTSKNYPNGSSILYSYDSVGNLISATDSTGTISMQYDSRNFLTQITYPTGQSFSYSYDSGGKPIQRIDQSSTFLNYSYDTAGHLIKIMESSNILIQYTYDSTGKLIRETKGNGVYTQYTYDSAGEVLSMINYAPSGSSTLSQFIYTYDSLGNRTSMTTLTGITYYAYDAISQLTAVYYPNGNYETYIYDSAGNRITVSTNTSISNYSTNIMNQYTQAGGTTFSYDTDGNMVGMVVSGQTTIYTYDSENKLISVVSPATTWNYTYDALGNRSLVTINGATRRYIYDPLSGGALAGEYDNSNNPIAQFIYGLGLVAQEATTGSLAYYDFDAIGNTRELTGTTGNILNSYDYTPFGILLSNQESINNPFRYVGRFSVIDDGNSLNFMKNRYYSGNIGRFLTEDPINIAGGINLYRYTLNNPVNNIDPKGLNLILALRLLYYSNGPAIYDTIKLLGAVIPGQPPGILLVAEDFLLPEFFLPAYIAYTFVDTLNNIIEDNQNEENDPATDQLPSPSQQDPIGSGYTNVILPGDPNEKLGPTGYGGDSVQYIGVTDPLNYMIYFENDSTASAPAQQVIVTDNLVSYLNNSTFALNEISFGSNHIAISQDTQQYFTRLTIPDWRAGTTNQWWVTVTANFNPGTGQATWVLTIIDPQTGQIPTDPLAGFLPPEDGSGRGTGFVSFTVYPMSNVAPGTIINNFADVKFDTNPIISTDTWFNTIANLPPAAPAFPQPNTSTDSVSLNSLLSWNAADRATNYNIYFWQNGYSQPTSPTASNLNVTYWIPSPLQYNTQYDWFVVANNAFGSATSTQWNFATASASVPIELSNFQTETDDIPIEGIYQDNKLNH